MNKEKSNIAIRIGRSLLITVGVFLVGYILVTFFSLLFAFLIMDWDVADHMFNWNLIGKNGWVYFRLGIIFSVIVGQLFYWLELDD
jgi:ABC-type antimicrobial peptide transport system permease subunit